MKIAVMGMSHISALVRAYAENRPGLRDAARFVFVQLRRPEFKMKNGRFSPSDLEPRHQARLAREIAVATTGAQLAALCIRGNVFQIVGLVPHPGQGVVASGLELSDRIREHLVEDVAINCNWVKFIVESSKARTVVFPPPPPVESEAWIRANAGGFAARIEERGLNPAAYRLRLWETYVDMIRTQALELSVEFSGVPGEARSASGFRKENYGTDEPIHGNEDYGELMLRHLSALAADPGSGAVPVPERQPAIPAARPEAGPPAAGAVRRREPQASRQEESRHPYQGLPDRAFWKQGVTHVAATEFDPVAEVPFKIARSDKVATAGSCFAQHMSKRIRSAGFQFLVTERPSSAGDDAQARGFYDFSARYGNIYTARQLVQLFDRAFGYFCPIDSHWVLSNGRFCDPFRPRIEPEGFSSVEALLEDRQHHFEAVRRMFEELDILVFTLGLTECWVSRLDGAAYPMAPGVAGGAFDPARYQFANFGLDDVTADLKSFIHKLRLVNSRAKLLLTVSPVPLVATYEPRHVLVSTTYSKSVLRVAAEVVSRSCEGVCYFPSFEIITGNYNRGRYFGPDLRSVTEEGVDHVMRIFMGHFTDGPASAAPAATAADDDHHNEMMALAEAACDEEVLERK